MTMPETDRMTGADSGVCSGCVGLGDRHTCDEHGGAQHARLLAEEEVEEMEGAQ